MAQKVWFMTGIARGSAIARQSRPCQGRPGDWHHPTWRTARRPRRGQSHRSAVGDDRPRSDRACRRLRHLPVMAGSTSSSTMPDTACWDPSKPRRRMKRITSSPSISLVLSISFARRCRGCASSGEGISSTSPRSPASRRWPASGLYAATKSALEGLSQSLAQEVAPFGIWVTLVEPGAFRTDFLSTRSVPRTVGAASTTMPPRAGAPSTVS